jgi:hypothetical protein
MVLSSLNLARGKAVLLQRTRQALLARLISPTTLAAGIPAPDANTPILNNIANSFSRFAAYQQTAFDNGTPRSSGISNANAMSKQVQSAIDSVLGRGTAGGPSFFAALNSAFPITMTNDGPQVIPKRSGSVVSLYQPSYSSNGGYAPTIGGSMAVTTNGYAGTLSARQANLFREASIIANDGLGVLASLTPYAPDAELDQVESLRTMIRAEINALVTEFGRVDEPREERVLAYFSALRTNLDDFKASAFLDDQKNPPITVEDESQVAGLELLEGYVRTLNATWQTYQGTAPRTSLSKFVERSNILLPVIAQVNRDFEEAMDSVDFPESERRSIANRLSELRNLPSQPLPPGLLSDITVYDLTQWIDSYASIEGPSILTDSGQYGFNFITDRANQLFRVIAPVVVVVESNAGVAIANSPRLIQVFSSDRVHFALTNLLTELDRLAGLLLLP